MSDKIREIITISVGQAGVQLGGQVWEQYCAEHQIHQLVNWLTARTQKTKDSDVSLKTMSMVNMSQGM
jgi:hypothetical protein